MPTRAGDLVVLHHGAIGDFVLALSVIQAVREQVRPRRVVAVASAASARLSAGRSAVDRWVSPEVIGLHSIFREDGRLADPLLERLAGAAWVLSLLTGWCDEVHRRLTAAGQARVISVDPRPTSETLQARRHITSQWTDAAREQGLVIRDPEPPRIAALAEAPGGATRRVLIHPGAGARAKCWPAERFVALADSLAPASVRWMLGPAELELEPERFELIRRRSNRRGEPLMIEQDLTAAARHVCDADLYIGNDAGMTHLAAALGVRTVAIFGPTDPAVWRPWGDHVAVVSPPAPDAAEAVPVRSVVDVFWGLRDIIIGPQEAPRS